MGIETTLQKDWEGLKLDAVAEDPILAVERSPAVDAESELISGKSRGEWEGILTEPNNRKY